MGTSIFVMIRATDIRRLVAAGTEKDEAGIGVKACIACFDALIDTVAKEVAGAGYTFYKATLEQGDLLWVPAGYLIAARCVDNPLNYGIRKSVYNATPTAKKDIGTILQMYSAHGEDPGRLAKVHELYTSNVKDV